jgi:outer membrane autotransporter protein
MLRKTNLKSSLSCKVSLYSIAIASSLFAFTGSAQAASCTGENQQTIITGPGFNTPTVTNTTVYTCAGEDANARTNALSLRLQSRNISKAVADHLIGPRIERAFAFAMPSSMLSYAEAAGQTQGQTAIETMAQPTPLLWNIWASGNGAYSDKDSTLSGFEGTLRTGSLGIDRQLGDRVVIGAFLTSETTDYDTTALLGSGTLSSDGYGLGAYTGITITNWLVADALIQHKWTDSDFAVGATRANYDATETSFAANLTGYFYSGLFRFSPALGMAFSHEDQSAYIDSAGFPTASSDTKIGVLSFGSQFGYTFALNQATTIEPFIGLTAEWTFLNDTSGVTTATGDKLNDVDLRLTGGINTTIQERISLALTGDLSGLAIQDYLVATGSLQLSIRF